MLAWAHLSVSLPHSPSSQPLLQAHLACRAFSPAAHPNSSVGESTSMRRNGAGAARRALHAHNDAGPELPAHAAARCGRAHVTAQGRDRSGCPVWRRVQVRSASVSGTGCLARRRRVCKPGARDGTSLGAGTATCGHSDSSSGQSWQLLVMWVRLRAHGQGGACRTGKKMG